MNITGMTVSYTPGSGYIGHIPGCRATLRWGDEFIKQAKEKVANKSETNFSPSVSDRKELTGEEFSDLVSELSQKYDPTNMTQEEYDSFLDDLVENGVLSKNELGQLGYHGMMVVGSLSEGGAGGGAYIADTKNPEWNTYFNRYGFALSLQDTNGDALGYIKLMSLWTPVSGPAGGTTLAEKRCDAFMMMEDVLEAIQNHRTA